MTFKVGEFPGRSSTRGNKLKNLAMNSIEPYRVKLHRAYRGPFLKITLLKIKDFFMKETTINTIVTASYNKATSLSGSKK